METKSITIQVPEGMCIDREKSTFEKIVFKPIDTKPRSWEEYCKNIYPELLKTSNIKLPVFQHGFKSEDANALIALGHLIGLRYGWIGNWKPDWSKANYCIAANQNSIAAITTDSTHPLSFPTEEMANEFMNCFKDLLEQAKILL